MSYYLMVYYLWFTLWMIFNGYEVTVLVDGYRGSINNRNNQRILLVQHRLQTSNIIQNENQFSASIVSQNIDKTATIKSNILLNLEAKHSSSFLRRKSRIGLERCQPLFSTNDSQDSFSNEALPAPTTTQQRMTKSTAATIFRTVRRQEKFTRLPVWPVWSGVLIWIIEKVFGPEIGSKLEHQWTGRVCPNFYNYIETDPFIMLVHHCHSFYVWDLVRYIQRQFILPEGFPSHPHRGFITLTYIMHGGFVHRDSMGIQQKYGGSLDNNTNRYNEKHTHNNTNRYNEKHTQWLHTGSGLLHEEMFDIQQLPTVTTSEKPNPIDLFHKFFSSNRQELYQIWLNVPSRFKMIEPYSILLGGTDETPVVIQYYGDDDDMDNGDHDRNTNTNNDNNINKREQSRTIVIAGTYNGHASKMASSYSVSTSGINVALFHVQLKAGATWDYRNIPSIYETLLLYVRCGSSLRVLSTATTATSQDHDTTTDLQTIPVHSTAYLTSIGNQLSVVAENGSNNNSGDSVCDFIVLAGQRIEEPCVAAGSMVMTTSNEIQKAYEDYQNGLFGIPWDHKLTDEQWMDHVIKSSTSIKKQ